MGTTALQHIWAVWIGAALDLLLGDPQWLHHPVRAIGLLIAVLEKKLRAFFPETKPGEEAAGRELVLFVVAAVAAVCSGLLWLAGRIHPFLRFIFSCVLCYQALAARSLAAESMKVCRLLEAGDTEGARHAVSMIVGRDTDRLTREGIARAAVETVAENTSDGVVAPLFFLLLFGPVGGWMYKAVNTLDSMVGYKNDKYLHFGRAAARIDDLANWIPSRLTALLMIAAAWLLPDFDGAGAWKIWRRDRRSHKSPNSAQGESACAGALGVQLAGDAWYFGELYKKPVIGDPVRPVVPQDIQRANRLMFATSMLALLLITAVRWSAALGFGTS